MKKTGWIDPNAIWPDYPKFDLEEFVRASEAAIKEVKASLAEMHKFIEETPAVLRSDAPFEVKRRRWQQCLAYLYGYEEADDQPSGEVVQLKRKSK